MDHFADKAYFTVTASIANVFRSSGMPAKLYNAACDMYGNVLGHKVAGKIPGKCLKGRWASSESIESMIDNAGPLLAKVLVKALSGYAGARSKKAGPGADDDDDYSAKLGRWRQLAVTALSNSRYLLTVRVSRIARQPLLHALYWVQKQSKLLHAQRVQAGRDQRGHMLSIVGSSVMVGGSCD